MIDIELFKNLKKNDVIEIYSPESMEDRLYLQVTTMDPIKGVQQVSVSKTVADLLKLSAWGSAVLQQVHPESVAADFVEISVKDQYISRPDMLLYKLSLSGSCVYAKQKISRSGVRGVISNISKDRQTVKSAYVASHTKLVFTSHSGKFIWLVEMSKEMYHFTENGYLQWENCLNSAMGHIFQLWSQLQCNHSLTVILYSRRLFSTAEVRQEQLLTELPSMQRNENGYYTHDYYKIALDNEKTVDWATFIPVLRREIASFAGEVSKSAKGLGRFSPAANINFLEGVHLALSLFEKHYVDRDLQETGQFIWNFSAGKGHYNVDRGLAALAAERMDDYGVQLQAICLGSCPLHTVPLFHFPKDKDRSESNRKEKEKEKEKEKDEMTHESEKVEKREREKASSESPYSVPRWMSLSYMDGRTLRESTEIDLPSLPTGMTTGSSEDGVGEENTPWITRTLPAPLAVGDARSCAAYDEAVFPVLVHSPSGATTTTPQLALRTPRSPGRSRDHHRSGSVSSLSQGRPRKESLHSKLPPSQLSANFANTQAGSGDLRMSASFGSENGSYGSFTRTEMYLQQHYQHRQQQFAAAHEEQKRVELRGQKQPGVEHFPFLRQLPTVELKPSDRRWAHSPDFQVPSAHPTQNPSQFAMHWKLLAEPHLLPLTTDYKPSEDGLSQTHREVPLTNNSIVHRNEYRYWLALVSQRLMVGYQLILSGDYAPESANLIRGLNYHVIRHQPWESNVSIMRYVPKVVKPCVSPITYRYSFWDVWKREFARRSWKLMHTIPPATEWGYLDQLTVGFERRIDHFHYARFWRLRLAVFTPQGRQGTKLDGRWPLLSDFPRLTPNRKTPSATNMDSHESSPTPSLSTDSDISKAVIGQERSAHEESSSAKVLSDYDAFRKFWEALLQKCKIAAPSAPVIHLEADPRNLVPSVVFPAAAGANSQAPAGLNAAQRANFPVDVDNVFGDDNVGVLSVVYDSAYNARRVFSIDFRWTCCTGAILEELRQFSMRKAKQFGFGIFQVPTEAIDVVSPFHSVASVSFPVATYGFAKLQDMMDAFGFVLHSEVNEGKKQGILYYHITGVISIIATTDAFLFQQNHLPWTRSQRSEIFQLLSRFREYCGKISSEE